MLFLSALAGCGRETPTKPSGPASGSADPAGLATTMPATAGSAAGVEEGGGRVFPGAASSAAPSAAPAATAPSTAAAAVPPFTPLADARPGEWAEYVASDGRILKYTVLEAGAAYVRTRVEVFEGGKPLGEPAAREDPRELDPLAHRAESSGVERRAAPAVIEVAGRRWQATLYQDRWTDEEIGYLRRTWVSLEAPVFGMLRMELYGDNQLEARLELRAFGQEKL